MKGGHLNIKNVIKVFLTKEDEETYKLGEGNSFLTAGKSFLTLFLLTHKLTT